MILDATSYIGSAVEGVIGAPMIIGLPSKQAKIPNFIYGIIPDESARASSSLTGLQTASGDLFLKSAVNGSEKTFTMILTQDSILPSAWMGIAMTLVQNLTGVANNIGGGMPNLSGVSGNYVTSQLSALRNIKNGNQPIMILNSGIQLGAIGQNNNNLSSNWFIEGYDIIKEEAEGGMSVQIKIRELLTKRDSSLNKKSILTNMGNEVISPGFGSSIAGLL